MTKLMELNEDSRFVKKAFELVASRSRTSTEEIRKELRKKVSNVLNKRFYTFSKTLFIRELFALRHGKTNQKRKLLGFMILW